MNNRKKKLVPEKEKCTRRKINKVYQNGKYLAYVERVHGLYFAVLLQNGFRIKLKLDFKRVIQF